MCGGQTYVGLKYSILHHNVVFDAVDWLPWLFWLMMDKSLILMSFTDLIELLAKYHNKVNFCPTIEHSKAKMISAIGS